MEIYTIGVYGLTAEEFFNKLLINQIDTFIDIRRRRAVRGSSYSFVNSRKLQKRLAEEGIRYLHILDLAPTNEIRALQTQDDEETGIHNKKRKVLADIFISSYRRQILNKFDFSRLIGQLEKLNTKGAVLFCVEKEPKACHRSLVAESLEKLLSVKTIDL